MSEMIVGGFMCRFGCLRLGLLKMLHEQARFLYNFDGNSIMCSVLFADVYICVVGMFLCGGL